MLGGPRGLTGRDRRLLESYMLPVSFPLETVQPSSASKWPKPCGKVAGARGIISEQIL